MYDVLKIVGKWENYKVLGGVPYDSCLVIARGLYFALSYKIKGAILLKKYSLLGTFK